jgi:hypothetical protein
MATNNMINSAISMPAGVGSAGQAILSNGLGGSTFGAPAESAFFQSDPVSFVGASITLSPTFIGYRIITNINAGPCTWTADTGANYTAAYPSAVSGDTIVVYVRNDVAATITFLGAIGTAIIGGPSITGQDQFFLRCVGANVWNLFIQ